MPVKITITFNVAGYGYTESWIDPAGAIDDSLFTTKVRDYSIVRCNASGTNTFLEYARISVIDSPRLSQVRRISNIEGALSTGQAAADGAGGKTWTDSPFSALLIRCYNAAGNRSKNWFFRGYPDTMVDQGGLYLPSAQYKAAFALMMAKVKALAWGWRGVNPDPPESPIAAVANTAANQVQLTVPAAFFPAPFNKRVTVRVTGATGCPNINGQYTVIKDTATTAHTVRKFPIFGYTGNGIVKLLGVGSIPLEKGLPERVVERKPGKLLYRSAGRRRVQRMA